MKVLPASARLASLLLLDYHLVCLKRVLLAAFRAHLYLPLGQPTISPQQASQLVFRPLNFRLATLSQVCWARPWATRQMPHRWPCWQTLHSFVPRPPTAQWFRQATSQHQHHQAHRSSTVKPRPLLPWRAWETLIFQHHLRRLEACVRSLPGSFSDRNPTRFVYRSPSSI